MLLESWDGWDARPLSPPLGWFIGYKEVKSQDKAQGCDSQEASGPSRCADQLRPAPGGGFCCISRLIYATGLAPCLPEGRGLGRKAGVVPSHPQNPDYKSVTQSVYTSARLRGANWFTCCFPRCELGRPSSSGTAHSRASPGVLHDSGAGHGGGAVKKRECWKMRARSEHYKSTGYQNY